MQPKLTLTPHQAAKQFTADNADFNGVILVQSLTPAGRGGWKIKAKNTYFFVRDQKLNSKKTNWTHGFRECRWNGLCPVCNVAYPDQVIMFRKDAEDKSIIACDDCAAAHTLRPLRDDEYASGIPSRLMTYGELPPASSVFLASSVYRFDVLVDIRNCQYGESHQAQIVFTPREMVHQEQPIAERA